MRIAFVVHSVASCWNQGNAHFLRGVVTALQAKGHTVAVLEPADGWSRQNLLADAGEQALEGFAAKFPTIDPVLHTGADDAREKVAEFAPDLVVVHEWNDPNLVNAFGLDRKRGAPWTLLFHDTHHRAVSHPEELARFDLSGYDGVLAFGAVIAEIYERRGWGARAFVWHEAADTRLFKPVVAEKTRDLVWIGNWGDDERSEELRTFLVEPASRLGLATTIYGVRYPHDAVDELARRHIAYAGFLSNWRAPEVFARHRMTVHVPRRHYAESLHGIPTIRVFEALACGIPLVSAPWHDTEGLFPPGAYLTARDGAEMERHLNALLHDEDLRDALTATGLITVATRHTCDHRADELVAIAESLDDGGASSAEREAS
jgi:spore maturation protein CgeB